MSETVRIYESDLEAVEKLTDSDKPMAARLSTIVHMAKTYEGQTKKVFDQ